MPELNALLFTGSGERSEVPHPASTAADEDGTDTHRELNVFYLFIHPSVECVVSVYLIMEYKVLNAVSARNQILVCSCCVCGIED